MIYPGLRNAERAALLMIERAAALFSARATLSWASITLLAGVIVWDLLLVSRYAVDLPQHEDWQALNPDALTAGFTLKWLGSSHAGGRAVFSKLQVWLLYLYDGWNLRTHQMSNEILWILAAAALASLIRKSTSMRWGPLAAFLVFLFSLNTTYVVLGRISDSHFSALFALLAAQSLFDERQRLPMLGLGVAAAWASIFSYAAGQVFCITMIPLWCAFKLNRAASCKTKRQELAQWALVLLAILCGIALGWPDRSSAPSDVWRFPASEKFWTFFLSLIAHGFGWSGFPPKALGAACLALLLAPLAAAVWRNRMRPPAGSWPLYAAGLGMVAILAAMILVRGMHDETIYFNVSGHYNFFACLLVPIAAAGWSLVLKGNPIAKRIVLTALWLFCGLGYARSGYWNTDRLKLEAQAMEIRKRILARRLRANDQTVQPGWRQTGNWSQINAAKKLNVSFYKDFSMLDAAPENAALYDLKPVRRGKSFLGDYMIVDEIGNDRPHTIQILADMLTLYWPRDSGIFDANIFSEGSVILRKNRRPGIRFISIIPFDGSPAFKLIPPSKEMPNEPESYGRPLNLESARHTLQNSPARGIAATTLYRGRILTVSLLRIRGVERITEVAGAGEIWIAYREEADIVVGERSFRSRPGVILHVPPGTQALRVTPADSTGYYVLRIAAPFPLPPPGAKKHASTGNENTTQEGPHGGRGFNAL